MQTGRQHYSDTCLNQHNELREQKFKVVYDDTYHRYLPTEKEDELMTYNDIINHLHRNQLEDGERPWKFRSILAHSGPLMPTDRKYKGSPYNLLIEWETGKQTKEPLSQVIADDPVSVAQYAK